MVFLKQMVVILGVLSASFWAYGQSLGSCAGVHREPFRDLLADPSFDKETRLHRNAEGNIIRGARKLVAISEKNLKEAGVKYEVITRFLRSPQIRISTTGDHLLNKIAARMETIDNARLIYDPKVLTRGTIAAYHPLSRTVYLSHVTGLTGRADSSFFHEIKHWSISRKTRQGQEQSFDADYVSLPWASVKPKESGYGTFFSYQERSAWIFQLMLKLKAYEKSADTSVSMNLFFAQGEIADTMAIAADVRSISGYLLEQVQTGKSKVHLVEQKDKIQLALFKLGQGYMFTVNLPSAMKNSLVSQEARDAYVIKYLEEKITQTDKDLEILDKVLDESFESMMFSETEALQTLHKINEELL